MNTFKISVITIFFFISHLIHSQRGPERSAYLSFSRNNNPQSNKYGFDFTGLKFGFQFANCGGNVIVGINYSKNVQFTTYWLNGKSYGKDIIGEDLWPKPSDVEVNTVKADLYYGSQNLGKVTFNYIVGNFAGCIGETYDVLSEVGLSSSDKKYKDNLNMLSLANIQIVNARAIGMWRDGKISERLQQLKKQKETEKINEEVNALLQSVDYRLLAGNYEAAKELLQKAYKIKPSQEIKNKINETNELIRKKAIDNNIKNKTNEAYTLLNNGNYDLALAKFKEVYAISPSETIKQQIEYLTQQIEDKKKETIDNNIKNKTNEAYTLLNNGSYDLALAKFKEVYSISPSESIKQEIEYLTQKIEEKKKEDNSNKIETKNNVEPKNSDYKVNTKTTTKTKNKTNNSYSTTTNTYNPNLSKEANDAINYAINKQNYEEQRKLNEQRRLYEQRRQEQLRDEREWLAQKRKEEREARKREQEYEQFKKSTLERQAKGQEARLNNYNAKGGNINFNNRLSQWRSFANKEISQINKYLRLYNGQNISFSYPQNSCDYVTAIENISQSNMPNDYKATLIYNILEIRNQYYKFYIDNAFIKEEWYTRFDDIGRSNYYTTCSNYLESIANAKGFNKFGTFTQEEEHVVNNLIYNQGYTFWEKENYKIPIGALTYPLSFRQVVKEKGINMHPKQLGCEDCDKVWSKFHLKPYNWSIGWYHNPSAAYGFNDGLSYKSKTYLNKQELEREIALYNAFYETKRQFRLNTIENELQMMYFNYHSGDIGSAYNHFLRYIALQYGGFDQMVEAMQKNENRKFFIGVEDNHIGIAFSTLLMESGEYEKALKLIPIINNFAKSLKNKNQQSGIFSATNSLHNKIYFRQGLYEKMYLPKDEQAIKDYFKWVESTFKFIPKRTAGLGDVGKRRNKQYNANGPKKFESAKISYLITNDLHLKALALIKLGRKNDAKILLAPLYKFYTKKEKDQLPTFHGDVVDVEAIKEAINILYSRKNNSLKYRISSRNLLVKLQFYNNYGWYRYLQVIGSSEYQSFDLTPLKLTTSNLELLPEWNQIQEKLNTNNGSKESLESLYNQLFNLYKNKRFEKNETNQKFLLTLIQIGVALGNFHEILPIAAQYQILFPEDDLMEYQLSILMWPQKNVFSAEKKYDVKKEKYVQQPIIEYFESVFNDKNKKENLDKYLSIWARDKVSSPLIPFLYSLFETDNVSDKTTYKETQKQTYTKTSYKESTPTKDNENELGRLLVEARKQYDAGNKTYSRKIYQQALQLKPNNQTIYFNIYFNIGLISQQLNDFNTAKYNYQQAIKINPNYNKDVYLNLGTVILAGEQAIVDEMNKNRANTKKYDELEKQRKELFREVLPYLKKYWQIDKSNAQVNETLKNIYKILGMTRELIELKN